MKNKLLAYSLIVGISLCNILSLNAASNRVQIVKENYAAKDLSTDGTSILNTINTEKSDLVNGNIAIDITINNSKNMDIVYAIDKHSNLSSVKNSVIDSILSNAKILEELYFTNQGVVTSTDDNQAMIFGNVTSTLETLKTDTTVSNKEGEIFKSIDYAIESRRAKNTEDKNIAVIAYIGSIGTLSTEEINALKTKIDEYIKSGIRIIAYSINLNDPNFDTIFESAEKNNITTDNIENGMNFTTLLSSDLPTPKHAIATTVSFDANILNNFTIKNVTATKGMARYDKDSKQVIWEIGDIDANETVKLSYIISLNKAVDPSIIEKIELRTNRQIIVTQSGRPIGTYPSDKLIEEQICSPTIKILKEAIDNPKTGITNYLVFGACLLAVSAVTLVILNNKNQFNRI